MYYNFLNIANNIVKFFAKNEEGKMLAFRQEEQEEAERLKLAVADNGFFKRCQEEFKQQAIIDFSFREATILSQTKEKMK